jgi:hypothetical protein
LTDCCNSRARYGWNWSYHILPYIEQTAVYNLSTDGDDPPLNSLNINNSKEDIVAQQAIPIYYCPTRRFPTAYSSTKFYRCDYAGNGGERGGTTTSGLYGGVRDAASNGTTGVVIQTDQAKTRIEQIRDGSSNTIMVAEKALNIDGMGVDGGDNERWNNSGWDEDAIRWGGTWVGSSATAGVKKGVPPLPDVKAPSTADTIPGYAAGATKWYPNFGSAHPVGMNACMGDGSVKTVTFSVDLETFRRAALSADRLPSDGL